MPAYIGHTIMARDVYKKIDNKNVSRDYMITFSLGADLSKYSKCRRDTHNRLQNEFIYNMCDYMKENNLTKDPECLGVLYGHICHLMMDSTIHPLIWYVDEKCTKNKRNHTMIEMYYDNYLSLKHYDLRLDHHKNKELFKGKINKKISKLLNETYIKTYNCKHISFYYKFNIWLYKKIKYLYLLVPFNILKKIVGINSFLDRNKGINLINEDNKIEFRGYDKKMSKKDLNYLYDLSIKRSIEYIKQVNDYLYK